MTTLLETIAERNPRGAGWRCCLCDQKLATIEHADEGLTGCEDFAFTGIVDRLYCSECADCGIYDKDGCDCCLDKAYEQTEELGDPVLTDAVRKVLGLDS